MTRSEIPEQAAEKLQLAKQTFLGEGIDRGAPFLLAKYQIEKERDGLLRKHGHAPYIGSEVENHCT